MTYVEGLASYLGVVASYWAHAPQTLLCDDNMGACSPTHLHTYNIETMPTCQPGDDRREGNAIRFLWDIYDTQNDSTFLEEVAFTYGETVSRLADFPAGTGDGQLNEPFNASLTSIDDEDGGSMFDYLVFWGWATYWPATADCQM